MPSEAAFAELFPIDRREEITPDLYPHPSLKSWPTSMSELDALRRSLDPNDPRRLPADWPKQVRAWRTSDDVRMLRVHRGFFESMGVDGWRRFSEVMYWLADDPAFVRALMDVQAEFAARLAERVLRQVEIDAAIFSEPIAGNSGSLISPQMYEEFALSSYEPVFDVLRQYGVETIILRTYANSRVLVPSMMKWGFNCLWACEVNPEAMDYRELRQEFGRDLRLIGGIDLDVLLEDKEAIRREVEEKVPPLLEEGGFVPLADGRIRGSVPFENYVYYRKLLDSVIQTASA